MSARRQPFLKFFTADWRSDPALRTCSLAARGLWIDMLCLMHEATNRGDLAVRDRTLDSRQLAALVGTSQQECEKLLEELRDAGVFSVRRNGVIYSRKMEKEALNSSKKADNGKLGAAARYGKQSDNSLLPWQNVSSRDKNLEARVQRLEARGFCISDEHWQRWFDHRVAIKHPLTEDSAMLSIKSLCKIFEETGQPPEAVIDNAVLLGWRGLFAIKDYDNGQSTNRTGRNSFLGAIDRSEGSGVH